MKEIERKWILKELPKFITGDPVPYERYFLFITDDIEIRIQKKGEKYEFERKVQSSELSREGQKFEITDKEFAVFKRHSVGSILRESYIHLENNAEISIKVYKGDHQGLIRAEVEFESEEKARNYNAPEWFGKEITDTDLGKDKKLIGLSPDGCNILINSYL